MRATSSQLKFPGYKKVYTDSEEEDAGKPLPELTENQALTLKALNLNSISPSRRRFTEASLVKLLEENNIGRPSTYAPIIDTILKRNYVERVNKQFVPTELGFIVVDLKSQFP